MKIDNNSSTYFDSSSQTKLSLAILPYDEFTGEITTMKLAVSIKGIKNKAILNSSGYYLFFDMENDINAADENRLMIVVDSEDLFHPFEKQINLKEMIENDITFQRNPVVEVRLIPNAAYPFPPGTTLVRGVVLDSESRKPIPNAEAHLEDRDLASTTDENGEFLFYFADLKANDIIQKQVQGQGSKKFIRMGTNDMFKLIVKSEKYEDFQDFYNAEVGKITSLKISLEKR
jgi:hypothetical protein